MRPNGEARLRDGSVPTPIDENCGRQIALVSAYYPSHGGGLELATADLLATLTDAGFSVRWLAQPDEGLPSECLHLCVPISGTDLVYRLSGVPFPIVAPWKLPRLFKEISSSDIAVIIEANFLLSVLSFALAKLLKKRTMIVQHVGQPSTVSKFARFVMRVAEVIMTRPMIRAADEVVFVSDVVSDHFDGLRADDHTATIWHGIDTELFAPSPDLSGRQIERERLGLPQSMKLACFVGRLTESKGVLILQRLARLLPDWHFAIAGTGPVEPRAWNLENVTALGQLGRKQIAGLYRASDACILPSQSESFSLVVREALACGTRVICAEQILETDSGLASLIETIPVDLSDPEGTANAAADALHRARVSSEREQLAYIQANYSALRLAEHYIAIIERMTPARKATI